MIPLNPYTLLVAQIVAHISIIPMILYGSWYHWLIAVFVYFLNGCLGMTMAYHRLLSHRAWKCPKFLEKVFVMFAGIGMTGSAISWIAIHRAHHRFNDTDKDPHSPLFKGWFWTHWLSMFAKVDVRYVPDLLKQNFYVWQHKHYFTIIAIYAGILYLVDPFALIYAWLVPSMLLWNGGSTIVSISHRKGGPHNDLLLAILIWGEGYHANHHDDAKASRFGKYDLGGIIIEFIEKWYKTTPVGNNA